MLNGYANEIEHGSILKSEAKHDIYKYEQVKNDHGIHTYLSC